jgi:methyl-accepting chemotaxis protein
MSIDNIRISTKITLIVIIMAIVAISGAGFASFQMKKIDDSYSDLIARVDKNNLLAAQAAREAETYMSAAYRLITETTPEGNARLLAMTKEKRKNYGLIMAEVRKNIPEKAEIIDPVIAEFNKAFVACEPVIDFASTVTSTEDNLKAAARLKAECTPSFEIPLAEQTKMVDDLTAYSEKSSDDLTTKTIETIKVLAGSIGTGLLVTLAIALWIGIKGLSSPIAHL